MDYIMESVKLYITKIKYLRICKEYTLIGKRRRNYVIRAIISSAYVAKRNKGQ
jgi:hypothetical protein